MDIIERIRTIAKEKRLSLTTIEEETGLSNGAIGKWSKSYPSYDKVLKVANFLEVSVEWLITGKTPPIKDHSLNVLEKEMLSLFQNLSIEDKNKILGMIELKLHEQRDKDHAQNTSETLVEEKVIPFETHIKGETSQNFNHQVPYRGQIAAGAPLHRFSDLFDEEPQLIPSDVPAQYAWRIAGHSMEPLIKDGDMIFTKFIERHNLQDGDIVVVRTNDGYNCKRIYHIPEKKLVILKSENPDKDQYPDQEYSYGDGVDTIHQIEGKVIF